VLTIGKEGKNSQLLRQPNRNMIKITDYQICQKIPMEPRVIFSISTLLISKKGKIFPFSQKAQKR
jgi:hypothetical protein